MHTRQKQERVIEAVRRGLEGEAAVAFVRQSGFLVTPMGLVRHLRALGGRARILERIQEGKSNVEILELQFPAERLTRLQPAPQEQAELFGAVDLSHEPVNLPNLLPGDFDTTRLTLRVPNDLYHTLGIAARVEGINRNQLIVDILTSALSRTPGLDRFPDADLSGEDD
jgi:hypothetical protein